MSQSTCYVYWIHLPEHNDFMNEGYIGVSKNPEKRFYDHRHRVQNNHLNNALNKYKDLIHTILVKGTREYCLELEKKIRPNTKIGWNIVEGGGNPPSSKGIKRSEETREKISKRIISDKTKEKMRQANLGRKHTDETKAKMRKPKTKEFIEMMRKKTVTEETKEKLRQANLGKKHSEETKEKIRQSWAKRKVLI